MAHANTPKDTAAIAPAPAAPARPKQVWHTPMLEEFGTMDDVQNTVNAGDDGVGGGS